ncbi:MAG: DUF4249 domain-containing protein [Cytophagales bacterium]|nr:DUF4249 domain-containing protein [Cytophagales bacterium]
MRLSKPYVMVMFAFFGLCGCIESFNPKIPESDNSLLVVDGTITDQPGPYIVTISKGISLNEKNTPVSGAQVSIEEDGGIIELLQETREGVYQTASIQGLAGKRYRLSIYYQEQNYQSSWETIRPSSEIDSVYFKKAIKGTTDINNDVIGLQFYLDSHGTNEDSRYYRFELEETWKIGVSWPISYDYIGNDLIANTTKNLNYVCWKSRQIAGINITSTTGLKQNILSNHKIHFATGLEDRFTEKYSLLIKQFGISEKEYLLWEKLNRTSGGLVGLFEKQPASVKSNISNISDPSRPVLGYFSASGLTTKRIYVDPDQVPAELSKQYKCPLDSVLKSNDIGAYSRNIFNKLREGKLFYDFVYLDIGGDPSGVVLSTLICSDCVENGGSAQKPEFWHD